MREQDTAAGVTWHSVRRVWQRKLSFEPLMSYIKLWQADDPLKHTWESFVIKN